MLITECDCSSLCIEAQDSYYILYTVVVGQKGYFGKILVTCLAQPASALVKFLLFFSFKDVPTLPLNLKLCLKNVDIDFWVMLDRLPEQQRVSCRDTVMQSDRFCIEDVKSDPCTIGGLQKMDPEEGTVTHQGSGGLD